MKKYERILDCLDYKMPKIASMSVFSFDDITDPRVKKELQLIQSVQKMNDFFAQEQLVALYRGMLSNAVHKCSATAIEGNDVTYTHAVNALKRAIKNYKLDNYKNIKPVTYFTGSVEKDLMKLANEAKSQKGVRMSSDLNEHKTTIAIAQKVLRSELGREPEAKEIVHYAKNKMNRGGAGLTVGKVERIMHYNTMEYSGSAMIGKENADGAEAISFEEAFGENKVNAKKEYEKSLENEKVVSMVQEYTSDPQKRRFIYQMLGIGSEFQGKRAKTLNEAAFTNGLTHYTAKMTFDGFKKFAEKKGVI